LANAHRGAKITPSKLPVFSLGGPLLGVDLDNTAELIDILAVEDDSVGR